MNELFHTFPDIIEKAATSRLGILALMIVVGSVVALRFLETAHEVMRFVAFLLIFGGVALFAAATFREEQAASEVDVASEGRPLPPHSVDCKSNNPPLECLFL